MSAPIRLSSAIYQLLGESETYQLLSCILSISTNVYLILTLSLKVNSKLA